MDNWNRYNIKQLLGKCLSALRVELVDTLDKDRRHRFFPFPVDMLVIYVLLKTMFI